MFIIPVGQPVIYPWRLPVGDPINIAHRYIRARLGKARPEGYSYFHLFFIADDGLLTHMTLFAEDIWS